MPSEYEGNVRSACIEPKTRTTRCSGISCIELSSDREAFATPSLYVCQNYRGEVGRSWWETTTLIVPAEKITWKFFVKEFKKKYISEQYLNDRRNRFRHLKQANKPIEQYVAEFCKYYKYGAEYIKTEKDKCRKFTDGLKDELGPMFTAMEIEDF
ncbi:hypothetical protein V6N13_018997 [Hibiscus sabdariffa]